MSSQTPRLNLRKPGTDDLVNVEIDIVDNFSKIDRYIGYYLCSSSNRPPAFEGLKIIEQDTGLAYIYLTGIGWYLMGQQDLPPVEGAKGIKSYKISNTDTTFGSSESIFSSLTSTFSAINGRRYLVEVSIGDLSEQIQFVGDSQPAAQAHLRWANGTSVNTSSTRMHTNPFFLPNIYGSVLLVGEFKANATGNVTVGVGINRYNAFVVEALHFDTVSTPSRMLIRDVGT